ncbi:protein of unknown function DUF1826 [Thioalkalivibrio nitratireducens DSM 14787]|uniref:Uncharacterized protein n=1 Tax=Thioalkalivibrio nitratireducens (strain DSM 14787 / UNIQEM 213 / ALEN2) TaxID=1255043 RepID=L0E0N2_THIND|nr:DUF1826 domain-containing protein [Thioalkalivibrio nitratireducens]AGA34807.1 protein of unknown function DUF1826 [Thioalkalivibrio nitratireducens DSM 14787]
MLQATLTEDVVSPPDADAPHTATSTSVGGLVRIFEPGVQIAWFERAPVPAIPEYLQAVARRLASGRSRVVHADDELPDLELPDDAGKDALFAEIGWLTRVYTDLLGCPSVGLRIEVLDRPMCPRFHVDCTGIRLVCTWSGPGTEWLHDGWADRSRLGPGSRGLADEHSGLMLPGAEVRSIPTFAVGLLKGAAVAGQCRPRRDPPLAAGLPL